VCRCRDRKLKTNRSGTVVLVLVLVLVLLLVLPGGRGGGTLVVVVVLCMEKMERKARRWDTVGIKTVRMCRVTARVWMGEVRRGWGLLGCVAVWGW
jgi:hypothetical protein